MWFWFGAAALFLISEMVTGTFYLLLVALGLAASGAAAYAGLSLVWQIVSGLVVSLVGLVALHRHRQSKGHQPTQSDPGVVPDIGQSVMADACDDNGLARVFYRGATWRPRLADATPAPSGHTHIQIRSSEEHREGEEWVR